MSAEQDSRERFRDEVRKALGDLRTVQGALHEAERLGEKYSAGGLATVKSALSDVSRVARDLESVAESSSSGGGCFPATALVSTPTGPRPIASVRRGDFVLSWSASEGRLGVCPVTAVRVHAPHRIWEIRTSDGESVATTPNHRFLSGGRWVPASRLRVGDTIVRLDGEVAPVAGVWPTPRVEPVYNLDVAVEHTYVVDGFVVHSFARLVALRTWLRRLTTDRAFATSESTIAHTAARPA